MRATQRHAFTLIEVVMTSAIMGMIAVVLGSAMHVMTRQGTELQAATEHLTDLQMAMMRFKREARMATSIIELSPTAIGLNHPDVNGDGSEDMIRYAWDSEQVPSSLTRQLNADDAEVILTDCTNFNIDSYTAHTSSADPNASPETVLASHVLDWGWHPVTEGDDFFHWNNWSGQFFVVEEPEATSFSITRVELKLWNDEATCGTVVLEVRTADPTTYSPTDEILQESTMPASSIDPTPQWRSFTFSDLAGLTPYTPYALVLRSEDADGFVNARFQSVPISLVGGQSPHKQSWDLGQSWPNTLSNYSELMFYVYGRLGGTGSSPDWPNLVDRLTVTIAVENDGDEIELVGGVNLLNRVDVSEL